MTDRLSGPRSTSSSAEKNTIQHVAFVTATAVIEYGDFKGRQRRSMVYRIGDTWFIDPSSDAFCGRLVKVPEDQLARLENAHQRFLEDMAQAQGVSVSGEQGTTTSAPIIPASSVDDI